MIHDKFDKPIKYVAEKHGLTPKQVEEAWAAQWAFARKVMSHYSDKESGQFKTFFCKGLCTFKFNQKKYDKYLEEVKARGGEVIDMAKRKREYYEKKLKEKQDGKVQAV